MPFCIDPKTCELCTDKRQIENCKNIYHTYKSACKFNKCKYSITEESTFEDYETLYLTLKQSYEQSSKCIRYRKEHSKSCVGKRCSDEGHLIQIKKMEKENYNCLKKIYKLSEDTMFMSEYDPSSKWKNLLKKIKNFVSIISN